MVDRLVPALLPISNDARVLPILLPMLPPTLLILLAASRNTPEHSESDMDISSGPCARLKRGPRRGIRFLIDSNLFSNFDGEDDLFCCEDCRLDMDFEDDIEDLDGDERDEPNSCLSSLRTETSSSKGLRGILYCVCKRGGVGNYLCEGQRYFYCKNVCLIDLY